MNNYSMSRRYLCLFILAILMSAATNVLSQHDLRNLRVVQNCDKSVQLAWQGVAGASNYDVSFVGSDGGFQRIGSTGGTTFTVENLKGRHAYRVDVYSDSGIYGQIDFRARKESCYPSAPPPLEPIFSCAELPDRFLINGLGDGTHCQTVGIAGIGVPSLVASGIVDAVDVWGRDADVQACFRNQGILRFLDAATSPRTVMDLASEQVNGMTCGRIDRAGTVVLMPLGGQSRECQIVTTGHLKLRASPSLDAKVVGFVRRGAVVQPISRIEGWAQVEYQEVVGWISTAYVSEGSDCGEATNIATAAAGIRECQIVTTGHLKLRASSSLDAEVIGFVPRGTMLRPTARTEGWAQVEYQGEVGWISAAYLSEDGDCGATAQSATDAGRSDVCVVTAAGHLKLRTGPSLNDEVIGYVTRGTALAFESRNAHWVKVAYQGATGWVGASYLSGDCDWAQSR